MSAPLPPLNARVEFTTAAGHTSGGTVTQHNPDGTVIVRRRVTQRRTGTSRLTYTRMNPADLRSPA